MNIKSAFSKLKFPKETTARQRLILAGTVVVVSFAAITTTMLIRPATKTQMVAPEQAAETTQEPKEDVPTQEQAIDAAIRAHERSTKVCYDPAIEGFLIHYPHMAPAEDGTTYFDGWYYLKYQQMWKTDNGIWFMKDYAPSEYLRVYPDVTGLNCKNT